MYRSLPVAALTLAFATTAMAAGANNVDTGMPNRISMNVTVSKQTQGATFGEKVHAGLQAAGGAVASGASLIIECGATACVVTLPDGSGYRAELNSMTLGPLDAAQGMDMHQVADGASLLGGALPGGGILSAAISSVSSLAGGGGGGGASSSAYAATGRSATPTPLSSRTRSDGSIDVTETLVDGDYTLTLVVEKPTSGLKDALKPQVRKASPHRIRIQLVFTAADGALRARHDVAKNSISNMR